MLRRAAFLVLGCSWLGPACSASEPRAEPPRQCTPTQFRACDTDACAGGVQQCQTTGTWGPCSCKLLDASYVDHDAMDGSDGDVTDAADAGDAVPPPDAAADADADGDGDADADGDADTDGDTDAVGDAATADS